MNIPKPSGNELRMANHHWLDHYDYDGHYFGRVILQWCPVAQKWAHSGMVGTNSYVHVTEYWKYVCKQEIPE